MIIGSSAIDELPHSIAGGGKREIFNEVQLYQVCKVKERKMLFPKLWLGTRDPFVARRSISVGHTYLC